MSKIVRKTAFVFGMNVANNDIETFGAKAQTTSPIYPTPANYVNGYVDPAFLQGVTQGNTSWWLTGWSAALAAPGYEFKQDRNAVDYVASYQMAYLLQMGIAEWDSATVYFTNSYVQYSSGIYYSVVDNNTNQTPAANPSYWAQVVIVGVTQSPTQTVLSSGSGTYTPPAGAVRLYIQMIGAGGGGAGSGSNGGAGGNTTFGGLTAGGGGAGQTSASSTGGTATGGSLNIPGGAGRNGGASSVLGQGGGEPGGAGSLGAGGSGNTTTGGGGAGAYLEATVLSPTPTAYSVGTGGTAGTGGAGSGIGGAGILVINEYYY